jgi:hypothetical protein
MLLVTDILSGSHGNQAIRKINESISLTQRSARRVRFRPERQALVE